MAPRGILRVKINRSITLIHCISHKSSFETICCIEITLKKLLIGVKIFENMKEIFQKLSNLGIRDVNYLTGLTRTGAAIRHMVSEGFSERRGARPPSDTVIHHEFILN